MEVHQAIFQRRSVRQYTAAVVPPTVIADLLKAATQAPSAVNLQPWAFAVVRGRQRLHDYSARAKSHLLSILPQTLSLHRRSDQLASEDYNVFHDAGTLVVICAKPAPYHPAEDCGLAAQNFMLAAHAMGLGTCPIGFVRPWLDLPFIKSELGIAAHYSVVLPLVVGYPAGSTAAPPRQEPEIICWHSGPEDAHRPARPA
ncbi:MAG: nitroreductase [Opitutaceae bacterium]